MFSADDHDYMQRALELAERGLYTTTPNPRVGCVLVRDGVILGEGFTQPAGQNHAELEALNDVRSRNRDAHGATAYVSLEPCSHFGRTAPCVNALIDAGISRVVAAMEDPNPLVSGKGFEILRAAGIEVRCGLLEKEARELNLGFVSRMTRKRPWVWLKLAVSIDGQSALTDGQSKWITSEIARRDGHVWRARACAILSGVGTVHHDDPLLNVRFVPTTRQPPRILVDSRLEVDLGSRLVRSAGTGSPVWIAYAHANAQKAQELEDRGCELLFLPNADKKVDLPVLMFELGKRGINELHVEAGNRLNASLIREGCADELLIYLAPCLLGQGQPMIGLPAVESLAKRLRLVFHEVERIGPDLRIRARFEDAQTEGVD